MSFQVGDQIGDYQIVKVLGAGGMGKVYQVRNVLSDRVEAMKVLLPNLEGNADLADRFLREIKLQASLDHPNIAGLHTALRVNNQLLMLMEFVEGVTLDQLAARGPIPAGDAVNYISQVLDALAYAHERGIVHRDIKPPNMMLTLSGQVKLMDFGIAKLAGDRKLTQTGTTVGSLYYMSPEQIRGGDFDARSDLYSLGISLYELVTGSRPFQGDSDYSIMAAHLQQTPVPPVNRDPRVPAALNDVILMSIAKDPAERFQTAAAFRNALLSITSAPAAGPAFENTLPAAAPYAAESIPESRPYNSRRGLYMALGSVATIAVLALAITQGPKFLGARADGTPAVVEPRPAPQRSEPAPQPAAQPAPAQDPVPVQAATPEPAQPVPAVSEPVRSPVQQASPRVTSPAVTNPPPVNAQRPPAAAAVPPPEPQAIPNRAATAPSQPAATSDNSAALGELRKQYNLLSIRAGSAKAGVQNLQAQMGGLGLRADIREASTRLDYLMSEAMQSIRAGDLNGARENLQFAERTLDTIEKFLGR
ncbi:MAG: protein kinase [Bryobacteraceae bacterium]|nr:protein kinase [Bryobacteraceae bacterium]